VELEAVDLVEAGSVSGRVLGADGEPVAGARVGVGLVPAYLPVGALPSDLAKSDAQGRFTLEGVPPGTVDLEAYSVDKGRGRAERVAIDSGRTTENVVITLRPSTEDFETAASGSIAVTLGERGRSRAGEVVVVHVAPRSEAERSGLSPGDVIVAVDDVEVTSMRAARERLGGPEGSDVVIDVERGDQDLRLRVRRERVRR
jgi:S1-C subfamily serine protease